MQGSTILILVGGALELGGFTVAMSRILEVRGISTREWARAAWMLLRFKPVPRTMTVSHGADFIAVREASTLVKSTDWDSMDTDARLGWLRDQQLETQLRLNRHDAAIENEPVLRDAVLADLARELRSEIRQIVADAEEKDVSKETYSLILFVAGLVLGTVGNLI